MLGYFIFIFKVRIKLVNWLYCWGCLNYITSDNEMCSIVQFKALFSSPWKPKSFQDSPSRRILWHMHKTLNIDENKN